MRPFVCAPILKSRQTCHRAVSPSITPCCCLRILLCYLLPGCVTSTHSLNSGIVTLNTRNPLALKERIECRYFTEMLQPENECITVDIFYGISYERLVTVRQIRWSVRMHYRPHNWS